MGDTHSTHSTHGGLQGMDVEQVEASARQMHGGAEMLQGLVDGVGALLAEVTWLGADASGFRSDWDGSFRPQMRGAHDALTSNADLLRRRAEAQRATSAR